MTKPNRLLIFSISGIVFVAILFGSYTIFENSKSIKYYRYNPNVDSRLKIIDPKPTDTVSQSSNIKNYTKPIEEKPKNKNNQITLNNTDPSKFQLTIPVLTYHHIATIPPGYEKDAIAVGLRVGPDVFDLQMKTLKEKGYTTLSIEDYEQITVGDKLLPSKPILLTIDDGFTDAYENAFPILKKHGLIGNFAIISDVLSTREYMSLDNVKEMQKAGMGIMSHTALHCQLAQKENQNGKIVYKNNLPGDTLEPCPSFTYPGGLTVGQADHEIKHSKENLEKNLNIKIDSVVYPYGNYNRTTVELAKKNGYKLAFTTKSSVTPFSIETTLFELPRTTVSGQQNLALTGFFADI